MDIHYTQAQGINIERLALDVDRSFAGQGFQTQHFGNPEHMTVQMKKGGDFAAFVGLQSALTVVMLRTPDGLQVMIGQQRWVEKVAVGAAGFIIPILWPLMFTAGVGVFMQASLSNQVVNTLDMLVHQQMPGAQRVQPQPFQPPFGQAPFAPFARFTHAPTPPLVCQNCQTANAPDDKYCMQCGKPLTAQEAEKVHCANCGADMKASAAFCTKCGTAAEAA